MGFSEHDIIVTIFLVTIFLLLILSFIFFLVTYFRRRQRNFMLEKQEMQKQFEKASLTSMIEIQEQTFRNISQEVHDNIGQVLSLAKLSLATTTADTFDERSPSIKELVSKAIGDLRDLSKSMHPDRIVQLGIVEAVRQELSFIEKTGKFSVALEADKDIHLAADKILIAFRMVQEALNNAIKHSEATLLTIVMDEGDEYDTIIIKDNGKGFDQQLLEARSTGLGLSSMNNRSKYIQADVRVESEADKGTSVIINIQKSSHDKSSAGR